MDCIVHGVAKSWTRLSDFNHKNHWVIARQKYCLKNTKFLLQLLTCTFIIQTSYLGFQVLMFAPLDTMSCYPNHVGACVPSHFSCILLLATLWTAARQAPWSMGFSRKCTGVDCCFLLQGIFLTQGSNPSLLCLLNWQADSLPLVPPGKVKKCQPLNCV